MHVQIYSQNVSKSGKVSSMTFTTSLFSYLHSSGKATTLCSPQQLMKMKFCNYSKSPTNQNSAATSSVCTSQFLSRELYKNCSHSYSSNRRRCRSKHGIVGHMSMPPLTILNFDDDTEKIGTILTAMNCTSSAMRYIPTKTRTT